MRVAKLSEITMTKHFTTLILVISFLNSAMSCNSFCNEGSHKGADTGKTLRKEVPDKSESEIFAIDTHTHLEGFCFFYCNKVIVDCFIFTRRVSFFVEKFQINNLSIRFFYSSIFRPPIALI